MARGKFKALREEPAYDEEVDGEYDEDGEYEDVEEEDEGDEDVEDVEAEYDEDDEVELEEDDGVEAEYDEDPEDEYADDEYEGDEYEDDDQAEYEDDEDEEPYRPPTALSAIKDAFTGKGRVQARPASGTDEDAQRVNYVNTRERTLGFFLGIALIALGALVYFSDKDATRATLKYPTKGKLTTAQAANLAAIHSAAAKDLIVYAVLGALIVIATYFKRRAAIAFTTLFAGLALFFTGDILGILYLGVGGWMILKVRKQTKEINLARASGGATRSAATRPPTGRRSAFPRASSTAATASDKSSASTSSVSAAAGQRQIGKNNRQYAGSSSAAPASKRYTPPKQVRRPAPSVQPEPEPSNRLSAWLRK